MYAHRALGMGASFFCTWAIILGYMSVVAFEAVALPTVVEHLFPNYKVGLLWNVAGWDVYLSWALVGSAGAVIMTWINIRGVTTSALLQKTVTLLILAGGIMLVTGALFNGTVPILDPLWAAQGPARRCCQAPMFVGFDVIASGEEINLPYKQIGKILMISVLMAVFWYIFVILAVSLALTPAENAASTSPRRTP